MPASFERLISLVALGSGVAAAMDRPALQTISHQKRPRLKTASPIEQGDAGFETPE
jgi:hypothetical protein